MNLIEVVGLGWLTISTIFFTLYFLVESIKQKNLQKTIMFLFFAFCTFSTIARLVFLLTNISFIDSFWRTTSVVATLGIVSLAFTLLVPYLSKQIAVFYIFIGVFFFAIAPFVNTLYFKFISVSASITSIILFLYIYYKTKKKNVIFFLASLFVFTIGGLLSHIVFESIYFSTLIAHFALFLAFFKNS